MKYKLNKIYSDYANVHQICREVLDVSNQFDIKAVLIGGSLLGVIRDGDFLPWDKDLDFAVFEGDLALTLGLETIYRSLGYECRVHNLGVRGESELAEGSQLLYRITDIMQQDNVKHCIIGGALLNLYRDACLFNETDTLAVLINPESEHQLEKVVNSLNIIGEVSLSYRDNEVKSILLITAQWRINFFVYVVGDNGFGWRDLNCEHWFDHALFPAERQTIGGKHYFSPANTESFLKARFGDRWNEKPVAIFTKGRVFGSMQLYKNGVMFDFIMHYVRGHKTYWFEPAANVISTIGFLPCSMKNTPAGEMLVPDHPEVFLEEHYPNWKVPIKTWDGAVDNPTIISSELAMQKILNLGTIKQKSLD